VHIVVILQRDETELRVIALLCATGAVSNLPSQLFTAIILN